MLEAAASSHVSYSTVTLFLLIFTYVRTDIKDYMGKVIDIFNKERERHITTTISLLTLASQ